MKILQFAAVMLTAFVLGPTLAHLLELPAKLRLDRPDYLVAQQLYRGWAFIGIPLYLAMILIGVLAFRLWRAGRNWGWALAALGFLIAAQVVFWVWTFPANAATAQWTMLPDNWEALRRQWEFSHAAGAACTFLALACLVISLLADRISRPARA